MRRLRAACVSRGARTVGRLRTVRTESLAALAVFLLFGAWPHPAHASLFSGETLDSVANVLSWIILVIVPVIGIAAFLLIHILPEKIAEKRKHPQLTAIKTLCLLSLVFGGMLWPLAWLWAYTKPVLHKLAYGTDVDETPHHGEALSPLEDAEVARHAPPAEDEVIGLRRRIAALEAQLAGRPPYPPQGGGT